MKVVSFYFDTEGDFYESCSKWLSKQCEKYKIDYHIEENSYGNDWISNVRAKPIFLKSMIEKFDCDILWIDVDSSIIGDVNNISVSGDWGVCLREDKTPHDYVHYISNTDNNREFIDKWISDIAQNSYGSHTSFNKLYKNLNIFEIPTKLISIGESEVKSKIEYFNEGI